MDQASIVMVCALPEKDRQDLAERIGSRKGLRQLSALAEHGMGGRRRLAEAGEAAARGFCLQAGRSRGDSRLRHACLLRTGA